MGTPLKIGKQMLGGASESWHVNIRIDTSSPVKGLAGMRTFFKKPLTLNV
jgi:hypothetical protein